MNVTLNGNNALHDEALLQQLYSSNSLYLSELDFVDDEVKFLKDLMERNFMTSIKDDNVNRIQMLYNQLKQVDRIKDMTMEDSMQHKQNIEAKVNHLVERSIAFLKLEHEKVEEEIKNLAERFKGIKIEILNMSRKLTVN